MIALAAVAVFGGLAVLILFAGYAYGRAETQAYYERVVADREDTIDALLSPGLTIRR